jgi:ankyrin repeat protein
MNLLTASANGNVDRVLELIKQGTDVNIKGYDGNTPLIVSSLLGRIEIVQVLLEARADVNLQNCNGQTALIFSNNEIITELLIKKGANIDLQNIDGNTAFMYASRCGNIKKVRALLEAGANIFFKNKFECTPLMYAKCYNRKSIFKLFSNVIVLIPMLHKRSSKNKLPYNIVRESKRYI